MLLFTMCIYNMLIFYVCIVKIKPITIYWFKKKKNTETVWDFTFENHNGFQSEYLNAAGSPGVTLFMVPV